jgi:hypothetical protein
MSIKIGTVQRQLTAKQAQIDGLVAERDLLLEQNAGLTAQVLALQTQQETV